MKRIGARFLLVTLLFSLWLPVSRAAEKKVELTEQCRKHVAAFEYPEAINACGQAIKLDDKHADAYFWRGG